MRPTERYREEVPLPHSVRRRPTERYREEVPLPQALRRRPTELIVALDVDSLHEEEELLLKLKDTVRFYKVGLRLFTAHGKRAVDLVLRHGGEVFLDLKFHDIPQTVEHAVSEVRKLGVYSLSLHLSGGASMLEAAAAVHPRPKLWGVSVLTSLGPEDLHALHPKASVEPMVLRLAKLGAAHGMDGTICSGREVSALRKTLGEEACFITPGIRPAEADLHDQKRSVTPAQAARLGIRYAVVGRPITKAESPLKAAQDILSEMLGAVPS